MYGDEAMKKLKVFLSSAMTELHNERAAVYNALTDGGFKVIWFEDFGARPEVAQAAYLEGVQEADVYVGIFWNQHSMATEEEYGKAERLGRPCFIYIKDFVVNREPKMQAFIDELRQKHTCKSFVNALALAKQVPEDVQGWIVHQYLQWIVEGYCVRCRQKRVMKDAKEVTMKNGRQAAKGTCPVCGNEMFKFLAKKH